MKRLQSKKRSKYLDSIARKSLLKDRVHFRRNLHLNHQPTNIKIVRIKDDFDLLYKAKGLKEMDELECYYIYHIDIDFLPSWSLKVNDSEIVYTNSQTNEIVGINKEWKTKPDFVNVWILKQKMCEYLKINFGDIIFTR